jgi:hypothetical protein
MLSFYLLILFSNRRKGIKEGFKLKEAPLIGASFSPIYHLNYCFFKHDFFQTY